MKELNTNFPIMRKSVKWNQLLYVVLLTIIILFFGVNMFVGRVITNIILDFTKY